MGDDRITDAMERIEKALARIETQAALSRHAAADRQAHAQLAERHETLRQTVSASLSELDGLIAGLER